MLISTLAHDGQITIPRAVRRALGLRPGMRLIFELDGDTLVLRPQWGALMASGILGRAHDPSKTGVDFRDERDAALQMWAAEAAVEGME